MVQGREFRFHFSARFVLTLAAANFRPQHFDLELSLVKLCPELGFHLNEADNAFVRVTHQRLNNAIMHWAFRVASSYNAQRIRIDRMRVPSGWFDEIKRSGG